MNAFLKKRVRFHKHEHKLSEWITSGILKYIQFRDNLYKNWKLINPESQEYLNAKYNLKIYNGILNRHIRLAKKGYYAQQFEKYRCDIRKTLDPLKNNINELKSKSLYPNTFFFDGRQVSNITTIANKFKEYLLPSAQIWRMQLIQAANPFSVLIFEMPRLPTLYLHIPTAMKCSL